MEVFRPSSPLASDLYLQVRAPSGALAVLASRLRKTKTLGGFIVAPKAHGQEDCNFSREIGQKTPSLRKYAGQKVTVRVYGNSRFAPSFCKGFGSAIGGGSSATAPVHSQKFPCTYVERIDKPGAKVYFESSVTPKRFEHAWCAEFQHHYSSPMSQRRLQPGNLGTEHRFCVFALRTSQTRVVLKIFANRDFAGLVTCQAFRAFPPKGFRLTQLARS